MFKSNDDDDFKKKREQYSISIRSQNRQDIFNKRRNISQTSKGVQQQDNYENIIDLRFAKEIKQLQMDNYSDQMYDQYVAMLKSQDIMAIHKGIIAIRSLFDDQKKQVVEKFIKQGVISFIIKFINQKEYPQLRLQAIGIIASMSYIENICSYLYSNGIIGISIGLVLENQPYIVDQALITLGNISADSTSYRDAILQENGLLAYYKCLSTSSKHETFQNSVWAITNLCRGSPPPNPALIETALPVLCRSLNNDYFNKNQSNPSVYKIISDVLWAISHFSSGSKLRVDRILQQNILPVIIKYAKHSHSQIYFPAIRIIGDIACHGEKQTRMLHEAGILDLSITILNHPKRQMRRQMCWIISNLAASKEVKPLIERKDILDRLNDMLLSEEADIKQEIIWVFANIGNLGYKSESVSLYLHYDLMKTYVSLLEVNNVELLENLLKTLHKILLTGNNALYNNTNLMLAKFIEYGGVQKVQSLQQHESTKIYKCSVAILTHFFQVNENQP